MFRIICTSPYPVISQPKTEEQRALQRHVGFVNFVSGRDAEKAKDALHGFTIDGAGEVWHFVCGVWCVMLMCEV
jgi:hypothetical protein